MTELHEMTQHQFGILEPVPAELNYRGTPANDWHSEIRSLLEESINSHERSQQSEIGASEVGTPCTRKLAYKLGEIPACNPDTASWRTAVGIACHTWIAERYAMENLRLGFTRFLIEHRVTGGLIDGVPLPGHLDIYDRCRASVTDWKNPGPTGMKRAKIGPGATYEAQIDIYGKGLEDEGYPVDEVNIVFLPTAGDLRNVIYWSRPYSRWNAEAALSRATAVRQLSRMSSYHAVAAGSQPVEDFCEHCPWFAPHDPDPINGRCEGAPVVADKLKRSRANPPEAW